MYANIRKINKVYKRRKNALRREHMDWFNA